MTSIKLTFIVYGDIFDVDEFSKIIGKSPTDFAYKNDILKFRRSTETFWEYSFQEVVSLYIEESITLFENIITPSLEDVSSFIQKNNLTSKMLFKIKTNKELSPAIVFSNNIINLLNKINGWIDLDLYINK